MDELNDQRLQRIKKLDTLRALGIQPHGSRFDIKDRAGQLVRLHGEKTKETLEHEKVPCTLAGRIVGLRRFGKAAFAVLQDGADRIQVYLKKDLLGEQSY
ncbi:MAG: lysine--tRNA ligase, partial [Nitrospirota bacterium]|nr:lysine--tRNA ligase [Nitrospirota bacterium]